MKTQVIHFKITDERMPRVQNCSLHIQVNDALYSMLNTKLDKIFTYDSTNDTIETILLYLGRRKLLNSGTARIPTEACNNVFERIRDDPCFKTVADQISLPKFFNLSLLLRTSYCQPRLNIFLSLHA